MAEQPKKKPTPRKAPKGPLSTSGGADGKARKKAVKAALSEAEAEEKAAAKEAVEHAKAASKERKVRRREQQKAAKAEEKRARAEEKARRRAESSAVDAAPLDGGPSGFDASEAADRRDGEAPELRSDLRARASERTVRFVSGEDAYRAPEPDSAEDGAAKRRAGARKPGLRRTLGIALAVLTAAVVVVVAVFSWNRWLRYDDAADFQGTWTYAEDGTLSVSFDGSTMVLTKDASYEYSLDTFAKTVTYRFGDLEGSGCYAFSEDRDTLVIVDGRAADVGSVLGFVDIAENAGVEDDGTSTVIVLARAPEGASASARPDQAGSSSSASEDAGSTAEDAEAGADGAASEGSSSASSSSSGSTGEDLDALGEDPGSEAGSNVVTPEDLGLASSEVEEP